MYKRHLFVTLLIALIGIVVYSILVRLSEKPLHIASNKPATYFLYSNDQISNLAKLSSETQMSQEEVYRWTDILFLLVKNKKLPPTTASKLYAYLSVAQYEAATLSKFSKGEYVGSLNVVSAEVICEFLPDDCLETTSDDYSTALSSIVIAKIKERDNMETLTAKPYERKSGDEYWDGENPTTPDAGSWRTWFINSPSEFRAVPPPLYSSDEDLSQVQMVKKAVENATDEQKEIVTFWAGGAGTVTPSGIWLEIADTKAKSENLPLDKLLGLRMVLTTAMSDSFISCWDTKFTYWTKRPNMRDISITTQIPTPNFPSYTSGHSAVSAAAATVLKEIFPNENWMDRAMEARDSRLWAGIHFPIDNERGFEMGRNVGAMVLETAKKRGLFKIEK